ncbi:MAG: hypothetical protein J0G28_07575 [Afipia sp.]|nr:hypothetical protein [Afipia sp.]OJW63070.1 MAG: hypothetical protein BGO65_06485 [Afipia sp. 64-13]
MRRLLRPLWVVLATIFLIEAWLWDHLQPIVARVVDRIPLRALKAWCAARVRHLSPGASLLVFIIPALPLLPLKVVGVWLLAHKYFISAGMVILLAKLLGVGVTAFVFDITRNKLLRMAWFRWLYETILMLRERAHELLAPFRRQIELAWRRLRRRSSAGFVQRLRRRVQMSRQPSS